MSRINQIETFETDLDGLERWKQRINDFLREHPGARIASVARYSKGVTLVAVIEYTVTVEESTPLFPSETPLFGNA